MVPAAYLAVDAIPLTVNGKVDRRALPAPEFTPTGAAYTEPRTDTERALCAIWAEVLGADRVGVDDDFFGLGGDSISSLKVTSRARTVLGTPLSPRALFDHPTVARLAAEIDGGEGEEDAAGPGRPWSRWPGAGSCPCRCRRNACGSWRTSPRAPSSTTWSARCA
ncbi:phosphopantetheine-binding protein [Actinomadura keratinilytica]